MRRKQILHTLAFFALGLTGCASAVSYPAEMKAYDRSIVQANAHYVDAVLRARQSFIRQMLRAKRIALEGNDLKEVAAISAECERVLTESASPVDMDPRPKVITRSIPPAVHPFRSSISRAAIIAYRADVQLARNARAQELSMGLPRYIELSIETQSNALAVTDLGTVVRLEHLVRRATAAARKPPIIWYRDVSHVPVADHETSTRGPEPELGLAALPQQTELTDLTVPEQHAGKELEAECKLRNTGAAYNVPQGVFGPGWYLFIFNADDEASGPIFYNGGGYGGAGAVVPSGSQITIPLDTYNNSLDPNRGHEFLLEPGRYILKVVACNGGGWDDVLDACQARFTVSEPR